MGVFLLSERLLRPFMGFRILAPAIKAVRY
jgi:hypothetical protein